MKIKAILKTAVIAAAAAVTLCLTGCENNDNVPAYGTGVEAENETKVHKKLSPTEPVETEPAALVEAYIYSAIINYSDEIGDYVAVTILVTNNTGEERAAGDIVGMSVIRDDGLEMTPCTTNPAILNDEGGEKKITNGEQMFTIYTCTFFPFAIDDVKYIDITLQSGYVDGVLDSQRFYLTEE